MRANIIIHSVTGNLYIIAQALKEKLESKNIETKIYKVEDLDLHVIAAKDNEVNEYYEEIFSLATATNEKLRKADIILLGTPSLFGLPSAEMMSFLEKTLSLKEKEELKNKKFYAFATSKYGLENGKKAILSLYNWAEAMDMNIIKEPLLVHDDGTVFINRPGVDLDEMAEKVSLALT